MRGGGFAGATFGGGEVGGVEGGLDGRALAPRDWPGDEAPADAAQPGGAESADGRAALGDPRCEGRWPGGARGLPVDGRLTGPLLPGRAAGPAAKSTAGFGERLNIYRALAMISCSANNTSCSENGGACTDEELFGAC